MKKLKETKNMSDKLCDCNNRPNPHPINEERKLLEEQHNWTEEQIHQYFCPNGTITMDEFCDYAYKLIDKYFPK